MNNVGTISNAVVGVICMVMVVTGFYLTFADYYFNLGSTAVLPNTGVNQTGGVAYIQTWANQTSASLTKAQTVPFLGGSFVLLDGAFQSLTLLVNFVPSVAIPLFNSTAVALGLPGWLLAFLSAIVLFMLMVWLLHAFGVGGV